MSGQKIRSCLSATIGWFVIGLVVIFVIGNLYAVRQMERANRDLLLCGVSLTLLLFNRWLPMQTVVLADIAIGDGNQDEAMPGHVRMTTFASKLNRTHLSAAD